MRQAAGPLRHVPAVSRAETPFCQAAAPAAAAVLACAHLIFASSLGGTSISRIHRRVAETTCVPPTAKPASAIRAPAPISDPPVISRPDLNVGRLFLFSVVTDITSVLAVGDLSRLSPHRCSRTSPLQGDSTVRRKALRMRVPERLNSARRRHG